jgi:hypothetical protein
MDETTGVTAAELDSEDADALLADLDPGEGANLVVGGLKNGDPCDGSEIQRR